MGVEREDKNKEEEGDAVKLIKRKKGKRKRNA